MKKKILIAMAALLVLALAPLGVTWWQLNHLVRHGVEALGPRLLGVPVTLKEVDLALFSGRGTLRGLEVANPSGFSESPALVVAEIRVHLRPKTLFSARIEVPEITILAPAVNYEVSVNGTNIGALEAHVKKLLGTPSEPPSETRLVIEQLQITDGQVAVNLYGTGAMPLRLSPVQLSNLGGSEGLDSMKLGGEIFLILTETIVKTVADYGLLKGLASSVGGAGQRLGSMVPGLGMIWGNSQSATTTQDK